MYVCICTYNTHTHTHNTHMYICIYIIYMYVYLFIYVNICARGHKCESTANTLNSRGGEIKQPLAAFGLLVLSPLCFNTHTYADGC